MRFVNPVRRLRAITKRVYKDLITITETIQTILSQTHVGVTDSIAYLKDSILRLITPTEDITITESASSTIVPSKPFSVSDFLSNILLVVVETLVETKSAVIGLIAPESISIEETTDIELEASKSSSISDLVRILLSVADSLAHTVSSVIETRTNEAIGLADNLVGNLRTSMSYAINELTHFMLSVIDSLSTTKSAVLNTIFNESISIADSLRSVISATLSFDITDGLKSIALKVTEALSTVVSSIMKLSGLSEDLSIAESIRSILTSSKSLSVNDILSDMRLAIVEILAKTKSSVLKFVIPESLSIGETTKSELKTSKPYALSDISRIVLSIVESISSTVTSTIKAGSDEAIGIADSIKNTILVTLPVAVTDIIESTSHFRLIESLVHTVSSTIETKIGEAIGIAEALGGKLSTATSYVIDETTDFILGLVESLSLTKSAIVKALLEDSVSIADNLKSTIIATLSLDTADSIIASIILNITQSLSIIRSSIIKLAGLSEDISLTEYTRSTLALPRSFSVSDSIINILLTIRETLAKTKSIVIKPAISESVSISETTRSILQLLRSYTPSDLILLIISIVQSVSYTVSFDIRTRIGESISISENVISRLLVSIYHDLTESLSHITLKLTERLISAPREGLIGEWLMNEGEGTIAHDTSGQGNDGTLYGPSWVDGIVGKALEFDGVNNDYVEITDIAEMPLFSLAATVYNVAGGDGRHSLLRNFWEIVGTKLCFWSYSFEHDYWRCSPVGTVPYNVWTDIVTTWDGSIIRHYAGGALVWADPSPSSGTSQPFVTIGGYSTRKFKGKVDKLRVYNRTLSLGEVSQLHSRGSIWKYIELKLLGFADSISIVDDLKSRILATLSLDISDIVESVSHLRIIDSLAHTVSSAIKTIINETLSVADTLVSSISTSTSYTINEITGFISRVTESLSLTKSTIMNGILADSISIADNIKKSTIIATLSVGITDGIGSLTAKIVESLNSVKSSLVGTSTSESISIAETKIFKLEAPKPYAVTDDVDYTQFAYFGTFKFGEMKFGYQSPE